MDAREQAEQAVKNITKENISIYPDDWKIDHNIFVVMADQLWENRNEEEEIRDREGGVTWDDYRDWIEEAYNEHPGTAL